MFPGFDHNRQGLQTYYRIRESSTITPRREDPTYAKLKSTILLLRNSNSSEKEILEALTQVKMLLQTVKSKNDLEAQLQIQLQTEAIHPKWKATGKLARQCLSLLPKKMPQLPEYIRKEHNEEAENRIQVDLSSFSDIMAKDLLWRKYFLDEHGIEKTSSMNSRDTEMIGDVLQLIHDNKSILAKIDDTAEMEHIVSLLRHLIQWNLKQNPEFLTKCADVVESLWSNQGNRKLMVEHSILNELFQVKPERLNIMERNLDLLASIQLMSEYEDYPPMEIVDYVIKIINRTHEQGILTAAFDILNQYIPHKGPYIYRNLKHRLPELLDRPRDVMTVAMLMYVDLIALKDEEICKEILNNTFSKKLEQLLTCFDEDLRGLGRMMVERVTEIVKDNPRLHYIVGFKKQIGQEPPRLGQHRRSLTIDASRRSRIPNEIVKRERQ